MSLNSQIHLFLVTLILVLIPYGAGLFAREVDQWWSYVFLPCLPLGLYLYVVVLLLKDIGEDSGGT